MLRVKNDRKFRIFQRALQRHVGSGLYYSKAVPIAKEFTEKVILRYEKPLVSVPSDYTKNR